MALPCPYECNEEGIAILRDYDGYVMARPSARERWMTVTEKDLVLPEGAEVRAEKGKARIEIPGVCTLTLGENSCIDLDRKRSLNYFKKIRSKYAVFMERGEVGVSMIPCACARISLATEWVATEVVEGSLTLSGPRPSVVSCEKGRAELSLHNGASAYLAGDATVLVERVSDKEARVAARRGQVELRLSKKRVVTLSEDGFSDGEMCPCEVNVTRK